MIVMILLLMNCILVDDIIFNNDAEVDYSFVIAIVVVVFGSLGRAVGPSGFPVIVQFANLVYCRVNGYAWWAVVLGGMEDDRMRGCAAGWIRRR